MLQPTITEMCHMILEKHLRPGMVSADLTAGKGRDTLFLCEHSAKVYAFDIQEEAIEAVRSLVQNYDNVTLINDDHAKVKEYIKEPLDAAVFNFGYLPGGDHTVTTQAENSLQAVKNVLDLLNPGGMLVLCFYPHPEGEKEKTLITEYLLDQDLLVSKWETLRAHSPSLFAVSRPVKKQRSASEAGSTLRK